MISHVHAHGCSDGSVPLPSWSGLKEQQQPGRVLVEEGQPWPAAAEEGTCKCSRAEDRGRMRWADEMKVSFFAPKIFCQKTYNSVLRTGLSHRNVTVGVLLIRHLTVTGVVGAIGDG